MRKQIPSQPTPIPTIEKTRIKWIPPPQGWVKCDTDGAWLENSMICSVGWVLRDFQKKVLWLGARSLPKMENVLNVELEGLWAALSLSRLSYRKIIFETDSQQLVSLIRGETGNNHFRPIIEDTKQLLQRFEDVQVNFIKREGNGEADIVAKESLSFGNYDSKLYSVVQEWVKSQVENDNV